MVRRRSLLVRVAVCSIVLLAFGRSVAARADTIPSKLSDKEFWTLVSTFSEPDGYFRSDNLLSNEIWMQDVIPELIRTAGKPDRVYMGVGPEQNFTYITALKPSMVFIVDIRRGNLDLQLMYKALFELSSDRTDFVSRLLSKKRPEGMPSANLTAVQIFAALRDVEKSPELFASNLRAIDDLLLKKHGFELSDGDLMGIEYVYRAFYTFGARLQYSSTTGSRGGASPTYADLMTATDGEGQARSYLATEDSYRAMRDLERKNLVVPVVGNFGGPKALRAVGAYLKDRHATVSAFYLSNVEQYLRQDELWETFCNNVATLPLDESSTFIRSVRGGGYSLGLSSVLGRMFAETRDCKAP